MHNLRGANTRFRKAYASSCDFRGNVLSLTLIFCFRVKILSTSISFTQIFHSISFLTHLLFRLTGSQLINADFSECDLSHAQLSACDLRGSLFVMANCTLTLFQKANLQGHMIASNFDHLRYHLFFDLALFLNSEIFLFFSTFFHFLLLHNPHFSK